MEEISFLKKQLERTGEALENAMNEERALFEAVRKERISLEGDTHLVSAAKQVLLDKHQDLFKWQQKFALQSKTQRALELEKKTGNSRLEWMWNTLNTSRAVMESRRRQEETFLLSVSHSIERLIQKFQQTAPPGDGSLFQSPSPSGAIEDPGARAASFRAASLLLQQQRNHAENKEESYLRCEIQKKSSLLKSMRAERQNLEASAIQLNCVTPSPAPRLVDPLLGSSGEKHKRGHSVLNEGNSGASVNRSSSVGASAQGQGPSSSAFSFQRTGNEWFRKRSFANNAMFAETGSADDPEVEFDVNALSATARGNGAEDAVFSHTHSRAKSARSDSFYVERSAD